MRAYAAPGKGYDMQKTMLIDNACPPGLEPSEWARSAALAGAEAVRLPTGIGSVRPDDTAAGTLLTASEARPPEPVNDAVPVLFTVIIGLCALLAVLLMTLRRGRKLVRRLERERELDAATGLYNLTGLERVFRETVREENRASYYMLCFHFEVWHIERLRGPGAAEDFVRRAAGTLRQKAPEGAVVARGYRDNFFVLCRAEDAGTVRDWALRTIADLKSHGDADIVLSSGDAAVGLFPLSARICGFEQILYHASQCAISAGRSDLDIKVCGGDNCRVCEWERQLLEDFEHGLARGEFRLDLQLIMDARGFKAVGGEALSAYENCLRVGAELGLCPAGTEPMELVTRDEAAALLDALLTRDFQVSEPPMLTEFPIQNPDEVSLNDYLLELRRVPESILRAFADSGWTYAVDFQHLVGLTRRYGTSCTGAADYDKKHIYVSEAKATVHEFGHFLDSMLGFPPGRSSFYEAEAGAASAFLRAYAGTGCREYFADYFAYYIANRGNAEKAAQMERLTPETFAFFSALEAGGWQLQSRPHNR